MTYLKTTEDWLQALEDDNWGDAAEVIREKLAVAQRALAFAASVIKSGEPWTAECESVIGDAMRGVTT